MHRRNDAMLAPILVIFLAGVLYLARIYQHLESWSFYFQKICVSRTPPSDFAPYYEALVCGVSLEPSEILQLLKLSGLIHLFVVSGSHLVFIEHFLLYRCPRILRLVILTGFAFLSGLQPPVVRSWINLYLPFVLERWGWRSSFSIWMAGVLSLLVNPTWIASLSLQLSWGCALGLHMPKMWRLPKALSQSLWIFIFLYPLLWSSPKSYLSPICNWLIAPVIGLLLFPLSLLVMGVHQLTFVGDFAFTYFNNAMLWLEPLLIAAPQIVQPLPIELRWLWVFLLQFILYAMEIRRERKLCFK